MIARTPPLIASALALMLGLASPSSAQFGGGMGGMGNMDMAYFGPAGTQDPSKMVSSPVKLVSTDGKSVSGDLSLNAVILKCSLGIYELDPAKVKAIRIEDNQPIPMMMMGGMGGQARHADVALKAKVEMVKGDSIEGTVLIPGWWRLKTDVGSLTPNSKEIKSIEFGPPPKPPTP